MKKILVSVTGQLRNCSELIGNWNETIFKNTDPFYVFDIWDVVGEVDLNKAHLRSLKTTKFLGFDFTQVSKSNTYYSLNRNLDDELKKIRGIIGDNFSIRIHKYKPEYLEKAGKLEINDSIKQDCSPWWQGSIPVAYINFLAINRIKKEFNVNHFDAFCRVQSEANFPVGDLNNWVDICDDQTIITSPDTINKNIHLSIKFFASTFKGFELLMNAYTPLCDEYKNYTQGIAFDLQPIGERYLKKLALENNYKLDYRIRMTLSREQLLPLNPVYRWSPIVNKNWKIPKIHKIDEVEYNNIKVR